MSLCSNVCLSSKIAEDMATEITKKMPFSTTPHSFEAPLWRNPHDYRRDPYRLKVECPGYIFCCWQYGSIFFPIFVVSCERRRICIVECVMTVQVHPRSTIFISVERAYATFYKWYVVTLALSVTVSSKMRRHICWKSPNFPTPLLFYPKCAGISLALDSWNYACDEDVLD